MQTYDKKRLEIIIEAPMARRVTRILDDDKHGYTVLPVRGGSGRSGPWTREGSVSTAGGMVAVICIIDEDDLDALLEKLFTVVSRHIGLVNVTDCKVVRDEMF